MEIYLFYDCCTEQHGAVVTDRDKYSARYEANVTRTTSVGEGS